MSTRLGTICRLYLTSSYYRFELGATFLCIDLLHAPHLPLLFSSGVDLVLNYSSSPNSTFFSKRSSLMCVQRNPRTIRKAFRLLSVIASKLSEPVSARYLCKQLVGY